MSRPRTQASLAETLRQQMQRQQLSSKDLARRIEPDPAKFAAAVRKVKRWRSGETRYLSADSAARLEQALATRGIFTRFAQPERRGTVAELAESIERYRAETARQIAALQRRLKELEEEAK